MIGRLIRALRIGASISNPTPLKWAGAAIAVAIIALEVVKSYGLLGGVDEAAIIELVMAALVLYSQLATTDKIGVLPRDRRADDNSEIERLYTPMSSDADAPEPRNSSGFPNGPFFDS